MPAVAPGPPEPSAVCGANAACIQARRSSAGNWRLAPVETGRNTSGERRVALAVRDHGGMPSLDVIGVIVSDMKRAIEFYERLGVRFPEDPDPEGHGHVETTLPGGL